MTPHISELHRIIAKRRIYNSGPDCSRGDKRMNGMIPGINPTNITSHARPSIQWPCQLLGIKSVNNATSDTTIPLTTATRYPTLSLRGAPFNAYPLSCGRGLPTNPKSSCIRVAVPRRQAFAPLVRQRVSRDAGRRGRRGLVDRIKARSHPAMGGEAAPRFASHLQCEVAQQPS
jgi:hypothetical protein